MKDLLSKLQPKPMTPEESYNKFLWKENKVMEEFERNKNFGGNVNAMKQALRSICEKL